MINFWQRTLVLNALYAYSLGKAFLRFRNRGRREASRHLGEFYQRAWQDAAARIGATCEPIGAGILEIVWGELRTKVLENTTPIDDPVTHALASNKPLTYEILARNGLATPQYAEFEFKALGKAVAFLDQGRRECVVKPASGTGGGRGITTGIRSRSHLARAAAAAAVYTDHLLIEEQLEGDNYRLLYLDGVLLDAFVRRPPNVIADGRSNVGRLVQLANQARLRHGYGLSQGLLTVDLDMRNTLRKQSFSLHSVPPEGTVVTLKTVTNENCGADNTSATHLLCDSIVSDGARAARALGVRLAGVDIITRDPSVPMAESGGAIIEVNTPPNFYYHYHKRDGAFPVATHVVERLFAVPKRSARRSFEHPEALHHEARFPC